MTTEHAAGHGSINGLLTLAPDTLIPGPSRPGFFVAWVPAFFRARWANLNLGGLAARVGMNRAEPRHQKRGPTLKTAGSERGGLFFGEFCGEFSRLRCKGFASFNFTKRGN